MDVKKDEEKFKFDDALEMASEYFFFFIYL